MTIPRVRTIVFLSLILIVLAWLAGCAPVTHTPGYGPAPYDERLGTLRVIGPNVFRNQRRAVDGEPVYAGDKVSTGDDSGAWIDLTGGGFIQLDENTDPWLERREMPDGRKCIHLRIEFGQVWMDSDLVCIDTLTGALMIYSVVNVEVTRGSTTVTVFRGRAQVVKPAQQLLQASEQVTIARGRIGPVRVLNEQELEDVARWREERESPGSSDDARCLRELKAFIASRGLRPDRQSYAEARDYCARGDLDRAIDVVQDARGGGLSDEDRCLRELKAFIASRGLRPDRQSYAEARDYCARGDLDRAIDVVQDAREGKRSQPGGWCCTRNGAVLPANDPQCKGSRLYKTEQQAQQAGACRLY